MTANTARNDNANTAETTSETAAFPRAPETHQGANGDAKSKAHKSLRIELAKAINTLDEAQASEKLTPWERGFLSDLAARFKQYGLGTRLSASQLMIMNKCVLKSAA